ncbi:MAG: hypothetical protein WCS31_05165 [Verrucomicrobiae bacterium]
MKLVIKIVSLVSLAAVLSGAPLLAGEGKTFKDKVIVEEPLKWYGVALSTGWDSLYMFRGANVLSHGAYGNNSNYGSGIYWTDLALTWNITKNDSLTVEGWMGFGTQNTSYKEFDLSATYTHTFGDLALSTGYTLYYVFPTGYNLYANELNVKAAYTFHAGAATITPSLAYYYDLGPDIDGGTGTVKRNSSYLLARIDGSIPVYKDIVSLAPWTAFGVNFEYNARLTDGNADFYNGVNNLEIGLAVPVKINSMISVSAYAAYSYAFYNLWGTTDPNTFWGGAKVTLSF